METKYVELAKKLGLPIEDVLEIVADVDARIGTEDIARVRHILTLGWEVCARIIGDSVVPHEYLVQDGYKPAEISDAIQACVMSMLQTAKLLRDTDYFAK